MKILTKKQINTRNESAPSCSEHCMKQKSKVNIQKSKTRKFLWIAEKNTLGVINKIQKTKIFYEMQIPKKF